MSGSKLRIRFSQEASIEMEAGARWYEERRRGLGSEFVLSVEAVLAVLKRTPTLFPIVYKDVRRALIRRFPYGLFFRVGTDSIDIISVFHLKKDLARLKHR